MSFFNNQIREIIRCLATAWLFILYEPKNAYGLFLSIIIFGIAMFSPYFGTKEEDKK